MHFVSFDLRLHLPATPVTSLTPLQDLSHVYDFEYSDNSCVGTLITGFQHDFCKHVIPFGLIHF